MIRVDTVAGIVFNDYPILHCKIPILRVGVWPIWVGPAHSTLGQSTLYTSSLRYSKMSYFQWVLLKIQQFEFLRGLFCFILVLFDKLENVTACHFKITHQKMLIFEYVKLEVYRIDWPRVEWAGPTHMGHTPTLQMGLLQYKIGG